MELYEVRNLREQPEISVEVPGSKSMTNRALLMAAMAGTKTTLSGVLFSDDSRHFIRALQDLGFALEVDEPGQGVIVHAGGGHGRHHSGGNAPEDQVFHRNFLLKDRVVMFRLNADYSVIV